jgi:hypothetical protein
MKHASILTRFGRALFRERRRAFYVFVLWIIALLVGLRLQGNVALPTGIWVAGSVVTALLFALVSWLVSAAVRYIRAMAPILPLLVLQVGLAQLGLFEGLVPGRPELGGTLAWIVPLCLYVLALNLPVTRRVGRRRATYEIRCRTTLPAWLLYDGFDDHQGKQLDRRVALLEKRVKAKGSSLESEVFA